MRKYLFNLIIITVYKHASLIFCFWSFHEGSPSLCVARRVSMWFVYGFLVYGVPSTVSLHGNVFSPCLIWWIGVYCFGKSRPWLAFAFYPPNNASISRLDTTAIVYTCTRHLWLNIHDFYRLSELNMLELCSRSLDSWYPCTFTFAIYIPEIITRL